MRNPNLCIEEGWASRQQRKEYNAGHYLEEIAYCFAR